jgi:hypothetical protein
MGKPIVGLGGKIIAFEEDVKAHSPSASTAITETPVVSPMDFHSIARSCGIDEHSIDNYKYLIERFGTAVRRRTLEEVAQAHPELRMQP